MYNSFTDQASDYFLDLPERELAAIWEDIVSTPPDTPADLWKKKLNKIARENMFSSRFALMRILYCRAKNCEISIDEDTTVPADGENFEAMVQGRICQFRNISLAHAEALTPEEHTQYFTYLMEIAEQQADSDPDVNAWILSRAWYDLESANAVAKTRISADAGLPAKKRKAALNAALKENKSKYKNRLTREEALRLGHILNFSLEEMQWYLLRIFDVEEYLQFNKSSDLIEAYGFLTGASWQHVQELKEQYEDPDRDDSQTKAADPDQNFDRDHNWTQDISNTLPAKVEIWSLYPDTMDKQFLKWLQAKAWGLNVPSRTALRIYRNLAVFAYDQLTYVEVTPNEKEFFDCVTDICQEKDETLVVKKLLYENGEVSPSRCKMVADELLRYNKQLSNSVQPDKTKAWHIAALLSDGTVSPAGGIINVTKDRVASILCGAVHVEKGDMLYLLWFVANLSWECSDKPDEQSVSFRVMDFMDAAHDVLEAAMLPGFYPPHVMEQSMLLSIVCGGKAAENSAVVYEYMLYALTKSRNREEGAKRHDLDFKIQAVTYYRTHPEVTLQECAKKYEISSQTLSRWQKELLEEGKIKP